MAIISEIKITFVFDKNVIIDKFPYIVNPNKIIIEAFDEAFDKPLIMRSGNVHAQHMLYYQILETEFWGKFSDPEFSQELQEKFDRLERLLPFEFSIDSINVLEGHTDY